MYAYINKSIYQTFCSQQGLDSTLETSYQEFFKVFGTKSIIIYPTLSDASRLHEYKEILAGTCIRLRTEREWNQHLMKFQS